MRKYKPKKKIWSVLLISMLVGVSFYFLNDLALRYKNKNILDYPTFALLSKYNLTGEPLEGIQSQNYLIYDVNEDRVLVGKNEKMQKPLASVTKVMTALVAMQNCQDSFTVDGEVREKEEIIKEMLVVSSNEIADKIAANCPNTEDFVYMMNKYAFKNNLSLSFKNASGLDIDNETMPSALGDAYSVAKLLLLAEKSIKNELDSTIETSFEGKQNTNSYVDTWPFLVASKTGFTDTAGGNLATIFDPYPGKRIVIVVLGSSKEERFTDTQKLLEYFINNK